MSVYDSVQKGGLKLKGVSDHGSKRKKKKDKKKEKLMEALEQDQQMVSAVAESLVSQKTKAETAFENRKWKKLEEQLADRAVKSHKDRIMEFNKHLDSLSEHFDIPKVSWTK